MLEVILESGRSSVEERWFSIARHCHRTRSTRSFLFSRRVPSSVGGRGVRALVCGARLREPKQPRFSDLSGYNRDSRGRFVFRELVVETLPCPCTPRARRACLFITPLPTPANDVTSGDTSGSDAWAIPGPRPATPRRVGALCSIRVRHCAASRSPDYRDKQPEKPR